MAVAQTHPLEESDVQANRDVDNAAGNAWFAPLGQNCPTQMRPKSANNMWRLHSHAAVSD